MLLGALGALLLVAAGVFWWQGRAAVEHNAPPQQLAVSGAVGEKDELPSADAGDAEGPDLPEASEQTREQRRYGHIDKDRDGKITRNEMLAPRVRDFRKLDVDGNNLLTFEEWAVKTSNRFKAADANGDQSLSATEFVTTKAKPAKKAACKCK
jgi:hypothetical protein